MKTRIIYTNFWKDNYISELTAEEKLAFLYLLTNDSVSICGIYQLPDKHICVDLSLTAEQWKSIKEKFTKEGRFYFKDGWVKILNFFKYNKYLGEKNEEAIKRELTTVPDELILYRYSIDRVSSAADTLNNQNHNHNQNNNQNHKSKSELLESVKTFSDPVNKLISLFEPVNPSYKQLYSNRSQRQALERMINEHGFEKVEWAVRSLSHVVGQPYAPTITTPYELEKKLGALIAYLQKEKGTVNKFSVTKV